MEKNTIKIFIKRITPGFVIVTMESRLVGRAGGAKYRLIQEFDYFNLLCLGNNQVEMWNEFKTNKKNVLGLYKDYLID